MNLMPPLRGASRGPFFLVAFVGLMLGVWWMDGANSPTPADDAVTPPFPEWDAPIVPELAAAGAELFRSKCAACHNVTGDEKLGPNLADVTRRESASWMRGMILRPDSMTEHDATARELKARYAVQMTVPGGISGGDARAVYEFLRRGDQGRAER
ncbi:MAG: cytochrome c [Gemmatimonadota bacterium]|nr:cytochrome c [Gemmatimonadota bacterium]